MHGLMLLLSAAATAPAPAAPAAPIALSAPVKQDVQCFMLYAIAVQRAVTANDDKVKQGAGLGVMYFYTKLRLEAANLDLFEVIQQQAAAMEGNTGLKAVGTACDTEFQKTGADLQDLGSRLKQLGGQ